MNFTQLQSFVAVAETRSFTEAAYAIGLTQSTVSHALAALESELGVILLERNRKGLIALTNAGQKLLPYARQLLALAETIRQEAKAAHGLLMGKLRLGSMSAVSPRLLVGVLSHFQRQYPNIDVVLFEGTVPEVQEWIETSLIDVGFVIHPAKEAESMLLTTDTMQAIVASGHHLSARTSVTLKELREEHVIMPRTGCTFPEIFGQVRGKQGPHIRSQASEHATILAMIREGLGITILPRLILPEKLEGIVAIPFAPPLRLQIGLTVSSPETVSPAVKLFVQTAVAWVQEHAPLLPPASKAEAGGSD
ncbi:MAG: LysR family transcriptional regulator [Ktedonobacteraceae bacterium]|nr:LysR family transcriptional regulator [Ktedonobacteraceae bacterium]